MVSHVITLSNLKKLKALGTGTLGKTYLTQDKSTQSLFVVKTTTEMSPDHLIPELERLTTIQHPSLLPPNGYSLPNPTKKKPIAISIPFCQEGSLASLIELKRPLTNGSRLKILLGVAEGLRYLHELQMSHRYLTPSNIMITDRLEPKLCDFGLESNRPVNMAPFAQQYNTEEVDGSLDAFCYGAIVYTVLTETVFPDSGLPELPESIPTVFRDLINECWSAPQTRPKFDAIVLKFLNGEYTLPLENSEVCEFTEFQSRIVSQTIANQSIIATLGQISNVTAAAQRLSDAVLQLEQSITAFTQGTEAPPPPPPQRPAATPGKITSIPSFVAREIVSGRRQSLTTPGSRPPAGNDFFAASNWSSGSDENLTRHTAPAHRPSIVLPPETEFKFAGNSFDGFFAYLIEQAGGNLVEQGLVQITGNSKDKSNERMINCVVDSRWKKCWQSRNEPSSFIEFDLTVSELFVTNYTIKTYLVPMGGRHLRSWKLSGQCPPDPWFDLDVREKVEDLGGHPGFRTYQCQRPGFVRIVKLTQTGPNSGGDNVLVVATIELFGRVK